MNCNTKSIIWQSTNNGNFTAKVNGVTKYTSTKYNFNVGVWMMAVITRTANGAIFQLTLPNNNTLANQDTYEYVGSGLLSSDAISPWASIQEEVGYVGGKNILVDYIDIKMNTTRA